MRFTKILALTGLFLASLCGQGVIPVHGVIPVAVGGGGSTWTLKQFKIFDSGGAGTGGSSCTAGTSSCTVNISSTVTGDLLVKVVLYVNNVGRTLNSGSDGGQTYTHCAGANGCAFSRTVPDLGMDADYVLSAASGSTTATCTLSGTASTYIACAVFEYAWSGASISFDTSNGSGSADTACTTCAAQALTISGTDAVIQIGMPENNLTALSGSSYTSPKDFTGGAGYAGFINASGVLTTPNWTQDVAGDVVVMALAFKGN